MAPDVVLSLAMTDDRMTEGNDGKNVVRWVMHDWAEYYDPGAVALPGSGTLAKVKSVKAVGESKGISALPENQSVDIQRKTRIHALRPRRVREGKR